MEKLACQNGNYYNFFSLDVLHFIKSLLCLDNHSKIIELAVKKCYFI